MTIAASSSQSFLKPFQTAASRLKISIFSISGVFLFSVSLTFSLIVFTFLMLPAIFTISAVTAAVSSDRGVYHAAE